MSEGVKEQRMNTISDYLYAKAARERIPLQGTFELSPVCNFACKMCYVRRTPGQIKAEGKRLRTWEEWLRLAEQCHAEGMLYVLLTGGEPFIYPEFKKLYEALHRMGIIIYINSNGTMIDRETVDWLKTMAPARINITLYGTSPETYGRICGCPDGYERAVRAIDMLQEAGIPVVINASMIPENKKDLESILAFGRERGIHTRMATYMFPPARRDSEESDSRFTPEESAAFFLQKNRFLEGEEGWKHFVKLQLDKLSAPQAGDEKEADWGAEDSFMRCRAGRSSFWISWDGSMTSCGLTTFPTVQYPFEEGFKGCWDRLTEAVRTTPVLKGCSGCPKKDLCRPCVAMIQAETGDVNAKAGYLCRLSTCLVDMLQEEWKRMEE